MSHESEMPTRDGAASKSGSREAPVSVGTILGGRYRIDGVLGFGGMGVVYRARDLKLDQEIALKRVRPDRVSPERRETLRREIILARKVTHENVCRVYDLVEIEGEEFVSMEYLPGRTLKELEERERMLPLGRGLAIAKGICSGLAAAHRIGVLHRDLKPENVLVGDDGKPHLMDFGIAIESALYRGDQNETVPGTPQFLAPELLEGEAPGPRTDVYAMGILLYEMFTGRVPFDDNDTARLVRRVLTEKPPRIETLRPDLPPELRDILERAIARDPESRFPDAAALSDAIAAFEGQVLDRVLAEVSVTRARMVKLMVILEANKSLAATFDPTETLRIILRTATSETDAERGTIFLKGPDSNELVSQILEGGSVNPIRLPIGTGIAGAAAETGQVVNSADAYGDPRFDKRTDASSGFKTESVLAAPMRTPAGEIVGVVEILNKRRRQFTKEDEEFLAEVAAHAALAVAAVREHETAVRRAREAGAASVLRAVTPLLLPAAWPEVPGFDAAPLRWRSESPSLALYAVAAGTGRLALLLLEHPGGIEESVAPLVRAEGVARRFLDAATPEDVVRRVAAVEPSCAVTAARWEGELLVLAARSAPVPYLLRFGLPVPFEIAERDGVSGVALETTRGDLLVIASSGLAAMATPGTPLSADHAAARLARAAETQPLSAAFATLVGEWKRAGYAPGERDVLLLAAKRLPESLSPPTGGRGKG
ncbi:MAG TPA: protein kinase [Thermoanaerobaculia bacterium]|nr:protein kinase [Thermoanaerobaculia bacterium]